MADPSGRIIDLPICPAFREGLTVLEYFISTHGARKGLADTALRTADSGISPGASSTSRRTSSSARRTAARETGIWSPRGGKPRGEGRLPEAAHRSPRCRGGGGPERQGQTGEEPALLVDRNEEITDEVAARIVAAGVDEVLVRSPLTCQTRYGVCRACYGRNLATGELVELGQAVGIIAAQSIGEPGTQLARCGRSTPAASPAWTSPPACRASRSCSRPGSPRARPRWASIDGIVEVMRGDGPAPRSRSSAPRSTTRPLVAPPKGAEMLAAAGDLVEAGPGRRPGRQDGVRPSVAAPVRGLLVKARRGLVVRAETSVEREYVIPHNAKLLVEDDQEIRAGDPITDEQVNPQEYLDTRGKDAVQRYLVKEVQKVYRSQGVTINDKHIDGDPPGRPRLASADSHGARAHRIAGAGIDASRRCRSSSTISAASTPRWAPARRRSAACAGCWRIPTVWVKVSGSTASRGSDSPYDDAVPFARNWWGRRPTASCGERLAAPQPCRAGTGGRNARDAAPPIAPSDPATPGALIDNPQRLYD